MVMKATLLSNWKSLTIEKYDGTSDLDEHLGVCIMQKPVSDMDELWRRAAKYMQMEELALYRNQVQAETTSTKKEVDKPIFYNAKEEGGRDQLPREPRYAHYTPLNVSRSHILDQALAIETLVMSKRANTPPKVGFSKRC
ncbi:hypothetical protein JHK87_050317 [Glycine soja]|nr:hypothetical protein JHK87_050317 [Glycine soja]